MDFILRGLNPHNIRPTFHFVTPNETLFRTMDEVPNYTDGALVWFLLLVILELLFCDEKKVSFNDTITSLNASVLYLLFKFGGRSLSALMYEDLYNRLAIVKLPWDSVWVWFLCLFTTDLVYYWSHRAQHEVGIFWAFHQMHHSSEYFNLSISMRQGAVQDMCAAMFEMLQVFIIPPNIFLVHRYMLVLRQYWVHAQFIPDLGPLEYIITTPKNHRVHHGRNPYCIDKNYGGTFIFWDIMFGTFAETKEGEEIAFGLVDPVKSFDQLWLQFFEFKVFGWDKGRMTDDKGKEVFPGFVNKFKSIFMPPGWFPGVPTKQYFFWRHMEDPCVGIPEVESPIELYNPPISRPMKLYLLLNTVVMVYSTFLLNQTRGDLCWFRFLRSVGFILLRIQMFGYYFDHKWFATSFDVISMGLTSIVSVYLGFPLATMYSQACLIGALALYFCGFSPVQKKKIV